MEPCLDAGGKNKMKKKMKETKNSPTELCGISPFQIIPGISASHFYLRKQEA